MKLKIVRIWLAWIVAGGIALRADDANELALEHVRALKWPSGENLQAELVKSGDFLPPGAVLPLKDLPAFCRVIMTLHPAQDSNLKIEVWLPIDIWNGRLLGTGNGGGAGQMSYPSLAAGLERGFAVANTDLGTSPAAAQVITHPDRWADWGHRGTHEMTVAAKMITQAFYGRSARRSYFSGASTGGQQALVEAQSYPEDYDGIIAGCPANNRTHLHSMFLWNWQALRAAAGSALTAHQVASLTRTIVEGWAAKSGGAPGDDFLTDPRLVNFDPATLLAKSSQGGDGDHWTPDQVAALKRIYSGPVNPRTGERIFTPPPYGSEAQMGLTADRPDRPNLYPFVFLWAMGPQFSASHFDFDRDEDHLDQRLAKITNANNPDLERFRRRGGKLLMFSGSADPICPFEDTVGYYERVIHAQGGLKQTQTFFRYYLLPGMAHVFGGLGPMDIGQRIPKIAAATPESDLLTALIAWAEDGAAPYRMVAKAYWKGDPRKGIRLQRPVFPYPQFPRYRGGDPTVPSNFEAVDHPRGIVSIPAERYLN